MITIVLSVGALQGYANRDVVYQIDAISYLDVSDAFMTGRWSDAASTHWSPLYPLLLSATRLLAGNHLAWEPALLKIANFAVLCATVVAFDLFLRNCLQEWRLKVMDSSGVFARLPEWLIVLILYTWFIWASTAMCAVHIDTPDMLSACFLLFALALIVDQQWISKSVWTYILVGCLLGLAYLAKAVAFPIALSLVAYMACSMWSTSRQLVMKLIPCVTALLLTAAPQVVAASYKAHSFTFSQSYFLSYMCYIAPVVNDCFPEHPDLRHGPRIVLDDPRIYEFAEPVAGTFPPWMDLSYWHEGIRPGLDVSRLALVTAANSFYVCVGLLGPLLLSLVIVRLSSRDKSIALSTLRHNLLILVPGIVGLLVYIPVIPTWSFGQKRYFAYAVLLTVCAIVPAMRLKNLRKTQITTVGVLGLLFVYPALQVGMEVADAMGRIAQNRATYWDMAQFLQSIGLQPGDRIFMVGSPWPSLQTDQRNYHYYWARLAGLKIIGQSMESPRFFKRDPASRRRIYEYFRSHGAKAAVALLGPYEIARVPPTWKKMPGTNLYAYMLDKAETEDSTGQSTR